MCLVSQSSCVYGLIHQSRLFVFLKSPSPGLSSLGAAADSDSCVFPGDNGEHRVLSFATDFRQCSRRLALPEKRTRDISTFVTEFRRGRERGTVAALV